MIHYLYIGHFERDDGFIQFSRSPDETKINPVITRPLERDAIDDILRELTGSNTARIPEEWHLWSESDFLVCDKYIRNPTAIAFVCRLVGQTGCDVADYCNQSMVTPEELARLWPVPSLAADERR
jgi:hypothetical protein